MMMKLSTEEMLSQWRMRRELEPLRSDCTVSRADGIDLTPLLVAQMRDWYLGLLDNAPLEMLAVTNIANDVALVVNEQDGMATITLPSQCRRVVEVKLTTWARPAEIVGPDSSLAMRQKWKFTRAGTTYPVAINDNGLLRLYGVERGNTPKIERLLCVMEPEDGFYTFDERALSLIVPEE